MLYLLITEEYVYSSVMRDYCSFYVFLLEKKIPEKFSPPNVKAILELKLLNYAF